MQYFFLIFSAVVQSVGDYLSEHWTLHFSWWALLGVFFTYNLATVGWLSLLKCQGKLSTTNALWSLVSVVISLIIGVVAFHETLSVTQWIGIGFALISMVLLKL